MNKVEEKVLKYIKSNLDKHHDKYIDGYRNYYDEWKDLYSSYMSFLVDKERNSIIIYELQTKCSYYESLLKKNGIIF